MHALRGKDLRLSKNKLAAYRHLKQDDFGEDNEEIKVECDPEGEEECPEAEEIRYDVNGDPIEDVGFFPYLEMILLGTIEGLTADWASDCRDGMFNVINSAFRLVNFSALWLPQNTMKFGISLNDLFASTNMVYATCDFSAFFGQFSYLLDYTNWENYVVFASRIGGIFVSDFWGYYDCIGQG